MTVAADPIVIAPLRRRHLRRVLEIEQLGSPRPWSMGIFVSELGLVDTRRYLVARRNGRIVGFAGLMQVLDDGHVTNIGVDPDHRRAGIATRLLLALFDQAVRAGVGQLSLEVRASNVAAQALYRRFGFAPAGVRASYYPGDDGPEDAIVMWAHDVDSPAFARRLADLAAGLPPESVVEELR